MNYIANGCVAAAARALDEAMLALENHSHNGPPSLVNDAYRSLLEVRGQLTALQQIAELEAVATERSPALRLVGR